MKGRKKNRKILVAKGKLKNKMEKDNQIKGDFSKYLQTKWMELSRYSKMKEKTSKMYK